MEGVKEFKRCSFRAVSGNPVFRYKHLSRKNIGPASSYGLSYRRVTVHLYLLVKTFAFFLNTPRKNLEQASKFLNITLR